MSAQRAAKARGEAAAAAPTQEEASFEERMARLQAVVARLEQPDLPLEESMALYKEGLALARSCRAQIDRACHEVSLLTADGSLEPFDAGAVEAAAFRSPRGEAEHD